MLPWNRKDHHPDPDEVRMTLGEHLEELRSRVIRALVAIMAGAIVCYVFVGYVMWLLTRPMYRALDEHGLPRQMYQLSPQEAFIMELKVAFIAGFILTAPYALVQLWGFIAAGLYQHERRWVRRFVPVSIALFFAGALFMLFIVAPVMLDFFIGYRETYPDPTEHLPKFVQGLGPKPMEATTPAEALWPATQPVQAFLKDPPNPPEGVPWLNRDAHELRIRFGEKTYSMGPLTEVRGKNRLIPMMRLHDYVILVLQMMAAFGIGFQMPVVVALLATIGIVSAKEMAGMRRHVLFAIAIASAVITPSADVFSMLALMVPMALLFEVGLLAARVIERERAKATG